MSVPRIDVRNNIFSCQYKLNLMAVNTLKPKITEEKVYMPSEISHLIAKLLFDTSIYADLSRLFKISNPRDIKMVQIILLENLSYEELIRQKLSLSLSSFDQYMENKNFSEINFVSSSSWYLCGLEEFLTLPVKSLTNQGIKLLDMNDEFSIKPTLQVLMSTPTDMFWDDIPCPQKIHLQRECDYIYSQSHYSCPDNDPANLLAIDCEMVSTGDMNDLSLARVSVVRCDGGCDLGSIMGIKEWFAKGAPYEVVYDQLVRPRAPVVDYLTKYSGITSNTLDNVTLTIENVQGYLKTIIKPSTIIVGHSITMDLRTLRLYHPYVIDTSIIYNTTGDINRKSGLVSLSRDILRQEMRNKKKSCGHDSIEDAYTALKLVMKKLMKNIDFGNKTRITHFKRHDNAMFGEWKDVADNVAEVDERKVDLVELCQIDIDEPTKESDDIQSRMDKFTLLREHPAIVSIPEMMFVCHKSMDLVVNKNGLIGQSQRRSGSNSVHVETSDIDVVERTMDIIKKKSDLVVSVLSDYGGVTPSTSGDQRLATVTSLQHSIEKIVHELPLRAAVLVILPGQIHCESTGKLFWKIK